MKLHILGIGGTFMGGLALMAREAGHRVSGTDQTIYPPMSTQLEKQEIPWHEGYTVDHLEDDLDCVIVGNALSRGNAVVEHVLNHRLPYQSGPQWLAENVLAGRRVMAVAGTHGKTTTTSMLAWILETAKLDPGFLIGGVPGNFGISARLRSGEWFVIEADEYDTAFFDKRAKFVHYAAEVLVLNNLEFDHADIYQDLAAIQKQFHHLVRTVPGNGRIICNAAEPALEEVLGRGCWTDTERFDVRPGEAADWGVSDASSDGSVFNVCRKGKVLARVEWGLSGVHNMANGLAAVAAARFAGVEPADAAQALRSFAGVKRRLEIVTETRGVVVYDDFAHHPTEIRATLEALRVASGEARLIAVFEPRSSSMRMGVHLMNLAPAFDAADSIFVLGRDNLDWDPRVLVNDLGDRGRLAEDVESLLALLGQTVVQGDRVVFLSNGSFDGAPARFAQALQGEE